MKENRQTALPYRKAHFCQNTENKKWRQTTAFSQKSAEFCYENMDLLDSNSQTSAQPKFKKKKKKKEGCTCKGFPKDGAKKRQEKKITGTSWFREKLIWENYIRKHRADLRHAKYVIDDYAPKLNVAGVYDVEMLKAIWGGLKEAFEMNQQVIKKLHERNILRGKTDTFAYNYSKSMTSNYASRKDTAKNIEKQNQIIAKVLANAKPRMKTVKDYAEEYKKHEAVVESSSQFPLWWKVKAKEAKLELAPPVPYFKQHVTEKSVKYPDKRPRVFFEISIKNVGVVGRMVAMLYSDYVPMTVKNFLAFCDPKAELSYKGNFFYLIFQNYFCQTGDVVENRGFSGTSIYGPYFGNEDFTLTHAEKGVLTMYQKLPNRNASQFLITFRKLESLDGQNVVFGKIIKGLHVLDAIESVGSKQTGRPKVQIYISDCDET